MKNLINHIESQLAFLSIDSYKVNDDIRVSHVDVDHFSVYADGKCYDLTYEFCDIPKVIQDIILQHDIKKDFIVQVLGAYKERIYDDTNRNQYDSYESEEGIEAKIVSDIDDQTTIIFTGYMGTVVLSHESNFTMMHLIDSEANKYTENEMLDYLNDNI